MKMMISVLILCMNVQALACTCAEPDYDQADSEKVALQFMQSKMQVSEAEVKSIETLSMEGFLTFLDRRVLGYGYSADDMSCERSCAEAQNTRYEYSITFVNKKGETCKQELEVTMRNKVLFKGFKSTVKKDTHPEC